jgi:hypothetical protein
MPKPKDRSRLVTAAAALEDELHAFAALASETKGEPLNTERSMSRVTRALSESVQFHGRIEERVKALVGEIDGARALQQESIEGLLHIAHELERRSKGRDALLGRFAALGSKAGEVNSLALDLTARKDAGADDTEVLGHLGAIEQRIDEVVSEARAIADSASSEDWPEIARQADGLRQQMQAARNKLALAHKSIAGRAPS